MIISAIISAFVSIISVLLGFLPTVSELPTILGVSMDTSLSTAFGYWYDFLFYFWPMQIVWQCVLWYINITIIIIIAQFFFGTNRVPHL